MIRKILAFRNDRFGEFLLIIPALRALKQKYPEAKITLVVDSYVKDLAHCIKYADEVIIWDKREHSWLEIFRYAISLKKGKFDACVVFNPSKEFNIISFLAGIPIRVGYARKMGHLLNRKIKDEKHLGLKHEVEYNLDLVNLLGAETNDLTLSLETNDGIILNLLSQAKFNNVDNLIAIHPWTSDPIKQWPEKFFRVLAELISVKLDVKIIIVGAVDESKSHEKFTGFVYNNLVDLTNKTDLLQLAALLKKCKLLISCDSGPVHLASCVNTPVLAIFKSGMPGKSPLRWGPRSKGSIVIQKDDLAGLLPEEVFEKVKEVLKK
ncbi:MAG: glycosyltransferase family 9 protein [Candidatus Omnitrophica bacterium]|nr:glycosyltransferase family 9 protein [Candidatus Omnitrophota bacterium]